MATSFRLAVCSVERPDDADATALLESCAECIVRAGASNADLVVLPEEPDVVGGWAAGLCTLKDHPFVRRFQMEAQRAKVAVVGSLSVQAKRGYANLGFLIDRTGKMTGFYNKKHPAPGEEQIITKPLYNDDPFPVFDFEGVRLAIAICMDIHFPEMFRIYGLKGADLVCMPTMYLDYTGDMLESLEKARAIDNGYYFALSRYITNPFLAGKSMGYAKVIAPDGRIICSTGHRAGVAIAEFDPKWRVPFWGEGYGGNLRTMFETIRRPDLYKPLVE